MNGLIDRIFTDNKQCFIPQYEKDDMRMLQLHSLADYASLPMTKWHIQQPAIGDTSRQNALLSGKISHWSPMPITLSCQAVSIWSSFRVWRSRGVASDWVEARAITIDSCATRSTVPGLMIGRFLISWRWRSASKLSTIFPRLTAILLLMTSSLNDLVQWFDPWLSRRLNEWQGLAYRCRKHALHIRCQAPRVEIEGQLKVHLDLRSNKAGRNCQWDTRVKVVASRRYHISKEQIQNVLY